MARGKRHVHKYYKTNIGVKKDYFVYMCGHADCSHRMIPEGVINKTSVCWGCSREFVVSAKHLDVVKLRCDTCRGKGEAPEPELVTKASGGTMEEILKKLNMGGGD